MNAVLQNDLHAALREIDQRAYSTRDGLRVNDPAHQPPPRVFVPSKSRFRP
jgi:hypothetical protein